jgi:outer membrane protein assembly factor BamB
MRSMRLVLALALAVGTLEAAPSGNWPQWRGPMRDGVSTETGLLATWPQGGPKLLWSATGLGSGFSTVAISGGRILTTGDRPDGQYIVAISEDTGKELWSTRIGGRHDDADGLGGARSTPTISGDLAYVTTTDGALHAVEAATGKIRWTRHLERDFGGRMMSGWRWSESPLVDGNNVIVTPGAAKAGLVALDKTTGKDVWRSTLPRFGSAGTDGAGYSSIVISNGGGVKQYVQLIGRGVVSVRASDGWFMWGYNKVANDIANIPTPVVQGNFVFTSTSYDAGSALLELSAAPEGRVTAAQKYFIDPGDFQNHHGGLVLVNGYLYGGHGRNNGFPVCIEMSTGKMMWDKRRGAGTGSAAVTAAEGRLYFRYQDGTMVLIEATPTAYKEAGRFTIPNVRSYSWAHPVIAGGRLYLREQDALHVYDIKR